MSAKHKNTQSVSQESALPALLEDKVARVAISEEGQIVYASKSFCTLSHTNFEKIQNANVSEFLRFHAEPEEGDVLPEIMAGRHQVHINGHKRTFEFQFDWLTTPDQKRYLIGSEAREDEPTEDVLKAFEAKILQIRHGQNIENRDDDLQRFLNMSHDVMIVMDDMGEIQRVNTTFHDVFGYADADLQGMDFIDLFHNDDKPYIRNTIQTMALDEDHDSPVIDFEARIRTKAGDKRWTEWRQQRAGNTLYCVGRDITATKLHEQALGRREKQLLQAEAIGRMGHWHWTIGEEAIEWSDEIFRIFGVDRAEFTPTLDQMTDLVHKRDIARVNQAFQRAIIEQNDYDMEFRILQPGGEVRFIRCEGRCANDSEGEVVALYGIMQDMTERMLYEEELRKAKDAAERAYAAKSQFLANMSHELRTPLNAIIGFSEMMGQQLLGPIGTEKYLEYITGIRESGEHLLDIISDILDMSKIEAGKYELDLEEINVQKVIGLAVHMMESRALEAGVKISTANITNEKLIVVADRRAFMQILLNLLSNAVKFTEEGGSVTLECNEREDYIALKIIDTGIGIPANKLACITNPFEQASSHYNREHEGSGLGLAITKELIELHGGAFFIDSTVGVGTTATVRLPYDAGLSKKAAE